MLSFSLQACINPTSSVKPDIEKFEKNYGNQVRIFQGKNQILSYHWTGDVSKPPVIFVHGSPGSWDGWAHFLVDENLQKNFHLIAVDRPGYGGSGKGNTEPSLEKQAEAILEPLKFNTSHLPAILVGHSYGGPVIARAAMDHPEQVAGLVFVAASVSPALEHFSWYQEPAGWWPIRSLIPTDLRVCNEEIIALKTELEKMLPLWPAITAPTVLIQGDVDDLVPPANLDFLLEKLTQAKVVSTVRITGMNHFIPWRVPEVIFDGIKALGLPPK